MPPVRPPIYNPAIIAGEMTQAQIHVAQAMNDTAKVDYAVLEGFRQGFGENFRKAFDKNITNNYGKKHLSINVFSHEHTSRISKRDMY